MSQYVVRGGKRLEGELQIGGSKNAVLPIIAATLLNNDITYIDNCPKIEDVTIMIELLRKLGCKVEWQESTLIVNTRNLQGYNIDDTLVKKMRSSIILLGALIGRCGKAVVSQPGGCQLGARPIDLHLTSLKKMGIQIVEEHEAIICSTSHLQGAIIKLSFPSVGATENIMLAAARADGETIIINPAQEPEIVDLQNFLVACGAKIVGAGTHKIIIKGTKILSGVHYKVIPDRIIAGTYLVGAALTRGDIIINNIDSTHFKSVLSKLQEIGCKVIDENHRIILSAPQVLKETQIITEPYPGFPTDMQSQMMVLLCTCCGKSCIKENLFESRFKIVKELQKMGASLKVDDNIAWITGGVPLKGTKVKAEDLRGGAALVLAGLCAEGTTIVQDTIHIKRGYQDIAKDLNALGAEITEEE